jgi:ABC-type multidrug transport system fused ATPase/permease subunit
MASSAFSAIVGLLAALQLSVTFVILVPRYQAGTLTIGDIVLFNTLLIQLNQPFRLVGMAIKESVEAVARFRPLAELWNAPEQIEPASPHPYHPAEGSLAFRNVTFHHPSGRGVEDITFAVNRGTPTFLVGETGSGKSTIVRLLLKELIPTSGRILADEVNLSDISSDAWFAHVGVVGQDIELLNDSLAVNIVLGRPFDPDRLRAVAAQASILDRIDAMPLGFDTEVGERGLKLSGGERQRIAIARSLYGAPSILILDEASSALDEETERQIMDGLRDVTSELTLIAVTHRTSSIREGDHVVRLGS